MKPTSAACSCQPKGGLPHGEHPYDYGYDDPADCPVHGTEPRFAEIRIDELEAEKQTPEISAVAELKRYAADDVGTQSYLTKAEASALLSLLIEADSFISHMVYRGSWPDAGTNDVERLIGRLRRAS